MEGGTITSGFLMHTIHRSVSPSPPKNVHLFCVQPFTVTSGSRHDPTPNAPLHIEPSGYSSVSSMLISQPSQSSTRQLFFSIPVRT